jgi:hypothetical protein
MTIHSVTPAWSRLSSSDSTDDGLRFKINRSTGLQVIHTYDTTEEEILSSSLVTQLGQRYESTFAVCKKRSVSKVGPIFSIVACEYEGETGPAGPDDNPLNKPVEYEWGQATSTEPIDSDANGRPIVTANGEQIVGLTKEISDSVLTMRKNFAVFTPWLQQAYLNSVNSDTFANWLPGTGKMKTLTAKQQKFNGFEYFEVNATVQFRVPYNTTPARAWWGRTRHEGFYERPASSSVVSFSGGGGSGAAAVIYTDSAGVITGVFVTNGGSGYTSTPTMSVTVGSGATFTVTVTSGKVTAVAVTGGGTGYKARIVRAVDTNGEPMTKPVLLNASGFRETNPANAVWIETEKYIPLPYSALGFV